MLSRRTWTSIGAVLVGFALAVTGCGGGGGDEGGKRVEITYLVGNSDQAVIPAEALAKGFNQKNPDIKVNVDTRPQGSEGDNVIKTRLATQEMADVFEYNAGSLFQALRPEQVLHPLNDEPWVDKLDDVFVPSVSAGDQVYGAPMVSAFGGGILYNKKIYDRLGLKVPKTWDEFMANNAKIKKAGIDPVIQSYGETWTSQVLVLADFHNIAAEDPQWSEKYTNNQVKYAQEPAVEGFRHLEEVNKAGYLNKNFASIKVPAALSLLAQGKGAHYPQLTVVVPNLNNSDPDKVDDVGFFTLPGRDAAKNGLTLWLPGAAYIPKSTEGDKLAAAKKFLAYGASAEGCETASKAFAPTGPYMIRDCKLPSDVPPAIKDLEPYLKGGKVTPALEFTSPVKGPALEQITVEVGSGLRPAASGAALYDEDVKKQAKQLGLKGW